MPSLRARLGNLAMLLLVKRRLDHPQFDLRVVRQAMTARMLLPAAAPPGVRVEASRDAQAPGEWAIPSGAADDCAVLFVHGGAFIAGSSRTHRALTTWLAARSGVRVLSLDYRLAPEFPFPAGLDDVVRAIERLEANRIGLPRLVLAGDSAGAALVLGAVQRLRSAGRALPAAIALICPLTDMTDASESLRTNARSEPLLSLRHRARSFALYAGAASLADPLLSPVYADLSGFPPMLVESSDIEVLWDDARRFVEQARAAGVSVDFTPQRGLGHDWPLFAPYVPEANASIARISTFVATHLQARSSG